MTFNSWLLDLPMLANIFCDYRNMKWFSFYWRSSSRYRDTVTTNTLTSRLSNIKICLFFLSNRDWFHLNYETSFDLKQVFNFRINFIILILNINQVILREAIIFKLIQKRWVKYLNNKPMINFYIPSGETYELIVSINFKTDLQIIQFIPLSKIRNNVKTYNFI